MADMLVDPDDLVAYLDGAVDGVEAARLARLATSIVQDAAGQRLVAVADDAVTLMGTTESWLALPERPVTDVAGVSVDGEEVTDYKRFGARLWREQGWSGSVYEPSEVAVVYSHGYAADDPELEYARTVAMGTAQLLAENPTAATGFSIDDYREQYSQSSEGASSMLIVPRRVQQQLRRHYGARAGLVRVG